MFKVSFLYGVALIPLGFVCVFVGFFILMLKASRAITSVCFMHLIIRTICQPIVISAAFFRDTEHDPKRKQEGKTPGSVKSEI